MRYSVPVRSVGQSRCRYRRRAIEYEYEYRTLARPEYEYEGLLFRDGKNAQIHRAAGDMPVLSAHRIAA